jgi:hypothetical protein
LATGSDVTGSGVGARLATLSRDPQGWLALFLGLQLVLWTLVPWALATSLPLDVVSDGLSWGHELQWGYYKHPPLPSWMVELSFDTLGDAGPFLLSQIAVVVTGVFVFLLGRAMMPARWAAVGTLLLAGVFYFSVPTPEFNNNVSQMPFWAGTSLAYFMALKTRRMTWWLMLGVSAALGVLCKYSTGLLLITVLLHAASSHEGRSVFRSSGPYVAVAVCLALLTPHLLWLLDHGFPSLHYAVSRAGHAPTVAVRILTPVKFLLAQVADIAPAFVVAAVAGLLPRDWAKDNEDLRFLLWLTLGPPLLSCAIAIASGLGLRDMWGAPMWNLVGLLIVLAAQPRWQTAALARLPAALGLVFGIGLTAYILAKEVVPALENKPSRTQWPDRALAQTFSRTFRELTHQPLRIVAADGWIGGLVAMRTDPRPSVWIDGSQEKSPWITPAAIAQDGALVLWRADKRNEPPPALASLPGLEIMGFKRFSWPRTPGAVPLQIGYGIIRAKAVP